MLLCLCITVSYCNLRTYLGALRLFSLMFTANAKPQESEVSPAVDSFSQFKHLLLPITDRNPYLSDGTRQVYFFKTSNYFSLCFFAQHFCNYFK